MSVWLAVSIVFGAGVIVGWALACLTAGWYRVRRLRRQATHGTAAVTVQEGTVYITGPFTMENCVVWDEGGGFRPEAGEDPQ